MKRPRSHIPPAPGGPDPAVQWGVLLMLIAVLALPAAAEQPTGSEESAALSTDLRVRAYSGRMIELEVRPGSSDDYASLAARVAGTATAAGELALANAERPVSPEIWIRVPLELLSDDYRALVLRALFPRDRREDGDWVHVARAGVIPTYDEGVWQVAEWFTGDGANFEAVMGANRLSSPELRPGQELRIPAALLHPAFRSRIHSDNGLLEFGSDEQGPYAIYRLKAGEALYSSVVVRFTGRTSGDDVRDMAQTLAARSGVPDVTDIPVGFAIKIPLDLLEPEYLPPSHPRRAAAEAAEAALAEELARRPLAGTRGGLRDLLVILDPGHGGRDLGTMNNGIWEHDYVYDVTCRLKQRLEQETSARVEITMKDAETGCAPSRTDKLRANRQGTIRTHPPFLAKENGEARIGVNLRWYLANSIYRRALEEGYDPDRVIFVSIHADSRHPSLRGVMVYVPGAGYRTRTYGFTSKTYMRYAEVREKPTVRFSKKQRVRSEAVSRKLADEIVTAFRVEKLPVQQHQPIRHRIIRGKQRYVPAVIRGNTVPTKVLVEMVNLSNPKDAALLASARERERLAHALLVALFAHFGENP